VNSGLDANCDFIEHESSQEIRLLVKADLERAVWVQSSAFQNDPLWRYLFPNPAKRAGKLLDFFKVFLKIYIRKHAAFGVGDPIQGVAVWSMPNQSGIDYGEFIGFDLLRLVFKGFLFPFIRALRIFGIAEVLQKKHSPKLHYYLNMLAVLPQSQGKGFAAKLIQPFMREAEENFVGVYTDTMNPENVGFYNHLGFACKEKVDVPKTRLNIWALYRQPKDGEKQSV
jgi:GNAT superfamily N-acetyltransferase